jgi:sec-independent protein translocase protein TatA
MIGSIGLPELIVILVIALLFVGPKKLPDVGRSIGEAIRGFRRALNEAEKLPPGGDAEKLLPGADSEESKKKPS